MSENLLREILMALFWGLFAASACFGAVWVRRQQQHRERMTGRAGSLPGAAGQASTSWLAWTVSRSGEFHRRAALSVEGATVTYSRPRRTVRWSAPAPSVQVLVEKRPRDNGRSLVLSHGGDSVRLMVSRDRRFPFLSLGIPYYEPRLSAYAFDLAMALRVAGAEVRLDVELDTDEVERSATR
ncbi:hypothetical protein [Phycicoccus avicenniae]|uniref:hypothetical protein n=1 Tax=Phycicoccus avicenniae TaxID=2828860 RepID=UPI003D2B65D3